MPNLELAVRDYLRQDADLMALLDDNNKQLDMDYTGPVKFSRVTIYRAGGRAHDYYPHDYPIITLNCFGPDREVAANIADHVAYVMRAITQEHTPLLSASVESLIYLPTEKGEARYVVTTVVTAQLGLAA